MSSQTDQLPVTFSRAASSFQWRRFGFAFGITLVAIAAFGAAFAYGYSRINQGLVIPGVDVAGISVAGLDRPSAQAQLRQSLPSLSSGSLTVNIGDVQQTIAYRDFGRDYNLDYMLDQAFEIGRAPTFIDQLQQQFRVLASGVTVPAVMTWDNNAFASRIEQFASSAATPATNASITRVDGHYVVTPGIAGQWVDAQHAVALAMIAVDNLSPANAQLNLDLQPVQPAITTAQAQAAADQAEHVVADGVVVSLGNKSATVTSDELRGWVHLDESVGGGSWQLTIERAPIDQWVQNLGLAFNVEPANATFGFKNGVVEVIPSQDGQAVDVETTTNNVMNALQARLTGGSSSTASLAMVAVTPQFPTAEAQSLASRVKLLSTWTTHFITGPLNGNGVNIQIPTTIINGYVVNPGAEFDFLTAIGPITSPPYLEGGALIHGQIRETGAIGGGMCSCSTTLFNTALRYGLAITHRSNHAIYISRYPLGLDATIWESGPNARQTMAFVNDTQYPVLIKGINQHNRVTFELWGVDDGRTVSFSTPVVQNVNPGVKLYEYTDTLPAGLKKFVNDPYDGMNVTVVRTVRDINGNIIHQDTFHSDYHRLDGITLVGRYPGDPPAGTTIPVADYQPGPKPTPTPITTPSHSPHPTPTPTTTPTPSHTPKPTHTPTPTPTDTPTPEPSPS